MDLAVVQCTCTSGCVACGGSRCQQLRTVRLLRATAPPAGCDSLTNDHTALRNACQGRQTDERLDLREWGRGWGEGEQGIER